MGVTAILLPGQGSLTPEMRQTVSEVRPDGDMMAGHSLVAAGCLSERDGLVTRTLKDVELAHA
jgi:hypothetical protein